ncbi:MAG: MBL fold metallo-hydrolase, partial [Acidimicrobiia bacterium]
VLIHDAQYTDDEYESRVGWGHTAVSHLAKFVEMTEPARLVSFHHDPAHTDAELDRIHGELEELLGDTPLIPGKAGTVIDL